MVCERLPCGVTCTCSCSLPGSITPEPEGCSAGEFGAEGIWSNCSGAHDARGGVAGAVAIAVLMVVLAAAYLADGAFLARARLALSDARRQSPKLS